MAATRTAVTPHSLWQACRTVCLKSHRNEASVFPACYSGSCPNRYVTPITRVLRAASTTFVGDGDQALMRRIRSIWMKKW